MCAVATGLSKPHEEESARHAEWLAKHVQKSGCWCSIWGRDLTPDVDSLASGKSGGGTPKCAACAGELAQSGSSQRDCGSRGELCQWRGRGDRRGSCASGFCGHDQTAQHSDSLGVSSSHEVDSVLPDEITKLLADPSLPEPIANALRAGMKLERIELDAEGCFCTRASAFKMTS